MEEEQSLCSTEVLEINEEEEEYYDVKSSSKQFQSDTSAAKSTIGLARASNANLQDGLKGAHGDGSGAALLKASRSLEARRSSRIATGDAFKGQYRPEHAQNDAAPPSQYPKCPEPFEWRNGSIHACLSIPTTKWICNMLAVEHPLAKGVPIQLEVYSDGSLLSKRVLTLSKHRNCARVTGSGWMRDTFKLRKATELLELVYLNRQTVVAHGPYKGQTVHRFQIKKVSDAVAETVADSEESEMELSSDEEQEEEGGGPSDAALQLKSPRPILVNMKLKYKHAATSLSSDITKWLAGVVKVPYPLEDSLCVQLEAYDGDELLGEKVTLLSNLYNSGYLGGRLWLIETLKLTKGDSQIHLTYLGRKKVVHYYQRSQPPKRIAYRFKVEKTTSHSSDDSASSLQKRRPALNDPAAAKKSAPSAVKRRRSNYLRSADGKKDRASSPAASTHSASILPDFSLPGASGSAAKAVGTGAQIDGESQEKEESKPADVARPTKERAPVNNASAPNQTLHAPFLPSNPTAAAAKAGTSTPAAPPSSALPALQMDPYAAMGGMPYNAIITLPLAAPSAHFAAPPAMPQVPIALPAGAPLSAGAGAPSSGASILAQFLAAGLDERSAYAATGIALGLLGPSLSAAGSGGGGAAMPMPPPPGPQ